MLLEDHDGVLLLRLNTGKGNALDWPFLEQFDAALDEFEGRGGRGLVYTGYDRFFSAGLAIPNLLPLNRDEMAEFMLDFRAVLLRLFLLPRPSVAAMNGHAIAGGLCLAMQADRRLVTDAPCKIGLNETRLGVGLPPVVVETVRSQIPGSSLFEVCLDGGLHPPAEMQRLGVTHEIVPADDVVPRSIALAHEMITIPLDAFCQVKGLIRKPVAALVSDGQAGLERWLDCWFGDETRERLEAVAAGL